MSAQLQSLYHLQTLDLALAKAQKTRASLDDGSRKQAEIDTATLKAQEADKVLHQSTADLQDKELNLKAVESKAKSFRDKLYAGSVLNPKELASMEKEIEMLGRQKDKLEEQILELFDIVEQRKKASTETHAEVEALKKQREEILARLSTDQKALSEQVQALTKEREAAVQEVDAALLKRYDVARARFGGLVVSKVDGNDCSVCHTEITAFLMRELKADKEILTCENCGRILCL